MSSSGLENASGGLRRAERYSAFVAEALLSPGGISGRCAHRGVWGKSSFSLGFDHPGKETVP